VIQSSNQLKSLVRNSYNGDSTKAQIIIRNYIMERFLERVSLSSYRDHIIIKGGVLIASIVGIDKRSTMDIDLTLKKLGIIWKLNSRFAWAIFNIEMNDNVKFNIVAISRNWIIARLVKYWYKISSLYVIFNGEGFMRKYIKLALEFLLLYWLGNDFFKYFKADNKYLSLLFLIFMIFECVYLYDFYGKKLKKNNS